MTTNRPALGAFRQTPPIPRGPGRLEWLKAFDEVIAADVIATVAEMREGGWTASSAHAAIVGSFTTYLTARITDAIALAADVGVLRESSRLLK